jgi:site-specific DNA recombinase
VAKDRNSNPSSFTARTNLALLYVRVSSKAQEDGFSLAAQEKLGHEYSQKKSLKIVKSWKVSESAWRSERTAFNLLVEYAKRHDEIRHIIFDVTDRMTRNDFDKLKIYTLIKEHGKTIHLARSNKVFDKNSGSEEEFMLDIEVAVAKKQSNDISRKTKMGMLEKAEQGLYPSVAPIGYKNNRLTHLIEVDEERAPFIRRAFTLMASGSYSLAAIVKILNQEGLRGRKGYRVGKSAIEKILKNPIYYGAFRWQGRLRDGSHPPLISKDLLIRHAPPCTATRVPTQTAAVLRLTTSSPAEIVGARFWAKKKRKGLCITIALFQKAGTTAGVMFPKGRSLTFLSRLSKPSL